VLGPAVRRLAIAGFGRDLTRQPARWVVQRGGAGRIPQGMLLLLPGSGVEAAAAALVLGGAAAWLDVVVVREVRRGVLCKRRSLMATVRVQAPASLWRLSIGALHVTRTRDDGALHRRVLVLLTAEAALPRHSGGARVVRHVGAGLGGPRGDRTPLNESGYVRLHAMGFLVALLWPFRTLRLVRALCDAADVLGPGRLPRPGAVRLGGSLRSDWVRGSGGGGGEGLEDSSLRRPASTLLHKDLC